VGINSSPIIHRSSIHFRALPPLSLYIHIPWCARKCPYCDFNSHEARGAVPEERYTAALIADLDRALPQVWGRRVYSMFFGGGTPSLFSARSVDAILSAVRARVALAADAEITLEANPGTAEAGKFRDFRAAGVNRLSVGIQSFDPRHLKSLGRIHDEREAQRAIVEAGMRTTATMVIGFDETLDERLEHLQRTRDFQDECLRDGYEGLFSFLCWTHKPYGTDLAGEEVSAHEYQRWIALSRIFLDNVKHIRTSVLTQNEDAFRALDYGADDFDLPIEDEVTQKAGAHIDLDLERLLDVPRKLGYTVEYRRAERPAALSAG